jgi:hypothetical protein
MKLIQAMKKLKDLNVKIEDLRKSASAEMHANAKILAAAPDLLAVLKRMLEDCDKTVELECVHGSQVVEAARAAIAKAEGK